MKRLQFILVAFGLGNLAKAQITPTLGISGTGIAPIKTCYPEDENCTTPIHWQRHDGKALNSQCPVCGTMAKPHTIHIETIHDGYEILSDNLVRIFSHKEPRPTPPNIARCINCNTAFWQDAV